MTDLPRSRPVPGHGLIEQGLTDFAGHRVLMLQGPMGPFFTRLARDLRDAGATVMKVDFNGGDWLFSARSAYDRLFRFREPFEQWAGYFEALIVNHDIDTVLLYGDCRPVHAQAIAVARRHGVEIGVFEEGYLRPDYITIERDGVNNHSRLPKDPEFFRRIEPHHVPPTVRLGSTFRHTALWAAIYNVIATVVHPWFPLAVHHRPLGLFEARYWIRSFWRKLLYRYKERRFDPALLSEHHGPFFLVPLQTFGDAQVCVHSNFGTVPRFIEHVMESFAQHAPAHTWLVIKHHPLDRGYTDHTRLIATKSRALGISQRCLYVHDHHLPTLLRNTLGVVTINSTVGLSAIGEGVPVVVCGEAIYDLPGLTCQRPLAEFWTTADEQRPDPHLWQAFRAFLIANTQFNGNFSRRIVQAGNASGVFWQREGDVPGLPVGMSSPAEAAGSERAGSKAVGSEVSGSGSETARSEAARSDVSGSDRILAGIGAMGLGTGLDGRAAALDERRFGRDRDRGRGDVDDGLATAAAGSQTEQ